VIEISDWNQSNVGRLTIFTACFTKIFLPNVDHGNSNLKAKLLLSESHRDGNNKVQEISQTWEHKYPRRVGRAKQISPRTNTDDTDLQIKMALLNFFDPWKSVLSVVRFWVFGQTQPQSTD